MLAYTQYGAGYYDTVVPIADPPSAPALLYMQLWQLNGYTARKDTYIVQQLNVSVNNKKGYSDACQYKNCGNLVARNAKVQNPRRMP